ncbi:MAG: MarR family winged helix-turn-helix transcriptional regulator [Pseudomonadota bacterium]
MRRIHFGLQSRAKDFDRKSVGPGGGIILMTLADMGCVPLNALTSRVARDKSQMTRTMHSLEKKGLIKREPSPTDKRVNMVSLTLEGNNVVHELMTAVADVIADILEPISGEEKQTLKSLLRRIHT